MPVIRTNHAASAIASQSVLALRGLPAATTQMLHGCGAGHDVNLACAGLRHDVNLTCTGLTLRASSLSASAPVVLLELVLVGVGLEENARVGALRRRRRLLARRAQVEDVCAVADLSMPVGEPLELVLAERQRLELAERREELGRRRDLVVAEREDAEVGQLRDGLGEGGEVVGVQAELVERVQHPDLRGQGEDAVVLQVELREVLERGDRERDVRHL
eukprot:646117-Rhodomonas_salina.2